MGRRFPTSDHDTKDIVSMTAPRYSLHDILTLEPTGVYLYGMYDCVTL
jgi:hypothetical protein